MEPSDSSGARPPAFQRARVELADLRGLVQPWRALGLTAVGLGFVGLEPGEGASFTHSHDRQEEVYVVLAGAGILLVDGEELALRAGDLVRVSPAARRALAAARDQRLVVLVAGAVATQEWPSEPRARYLIDDGTAHYDDPPPWAAKDPAALARNAELAARRDRSLARRRAGSSGDAPAS